MQYALKIAPGANIKTDIALRMHILRITHDGWHVQGNKYIKYCRFDFIRISHDGLRKTDYAHMETYTYIIIEKCNFMGLMFYCHLV